MKAIRTQHQQNLARAGQRFLEYYQLARARWIRFCWHFSPKPPIYRDRRSPETLTRWKTSTEPRAHWALRLGQLLLVVVLSLGISAGAIADELELEAPRTGGQASAQIDFSEISFSDFDPVETGGSISSDWDEQAGYAVGREWSSGARIEDVLRLGDITDFGAEKLNLQQIGSAIETDLSETSLADFELLTNQTLSELTESIDFLGEFKVADVAPVRSLLEQEIGVDAVEELADLELGALASEIPDYGALQLSQLDSELLEDFQIGDIPNAEIARLDSFEDFGDSALSEIPGLEELPFSDFPFSISEFAGIVARIDAIYGPAEDNRNNTISGSTEEGFNVPCSAEGKLVEPDDSPVEPAKCAYIELDDFENEGRKIQGDFEGKQWISGKYHEVEGGFGLLKHVPSAIGYSTGYEPTGRHPFGEAFKLVVWEPDETEDTTSFKLTFRWCAVIAFVRTCTPYNQFSVPFPFFGGNVNSYIFVGLLDGEGGATAAPANNELSSGGGGGSYSGTSFESADVPPRAGPCTGEVRAGINLDALGDAIALIESRGAGNYKAVGSHVTYTNPNTGVTVRGRALGRYQTMTYLPEVKSRVGAQPGGQAWLDKIATGYKPTKAEVEQYYPPEMQEEVFQDEIGQLFNRAQGEIDPQTGQNFAGNRLIERVAQQWFGGPGAPIDGGASDVHGRLSLYDYGVEARQNYIAQGGQPSNDCAAASAGEGGLNGEGGVSTGTYQNPVGSYPITSGFGPRNIGCERSKFHPAVDLGTPIGTPVKAADGGVVQFASCQVSGYGCTIVIDHGDGRKTRYSHLANLGNTRQGQAVAQGEQIAESGNTDGNTNVSTGPHLDFGIYAGDRTGAGQLPPSENAVNPRQYINF